MTDVALERPRTVVRRRSPFMRKAFPYLMVAPAVIYLLGITLWPGAFAIYRSLFTGTATDRSGHRSEEAHRAACRLPGHGCQQGVHEDDPVHAGHQHGVFDRVHVRREQRAVFTRGRRHPGGQGSTGRPHRNITLLEGQAPARPACLKRTQGEDRNGAANSRSRGGGAAPS